MVLKREPTPAGPITDLFDRLHDLHLRAGEPGVRQIATGIGRGVLSYTTVHNAFRGPRVPKWGHLELIVEQLGGDTESFHGLWTAARLAERETGRPVVMQARYDFLTVTYHQPAEATDGSTVHDALTSYALARSGQWVGLPRSAPSSAGHIGLPPREYDLHYMGYCNSTIWPLYHDAVEQPEFRREWQEANQAVNQRFADRVALIAAPNATVWVHDYHLQLMPGMLRRQRPDLRIGFFLHIPMPPQELFLRLPDRAEILKGLLGADVIGFQRPRSVQNFLEAVERLLGLRPDGKALAVGGRTVVIADFPISVDVAVFESAASEEAVRKRSAQIRADLAAPARLLLGVDRLDYTKGIEQRLDAYGQLLAEGGLPPETAFVQHSTLSREGATKYRQLRERVERRAGHLNGSYGRVGSPVVHYAYLDRQLTELVAFYLAADVLMVTPFKDGMNLVAKEYVACRTDNRGVLVLSEFAGAAADLTGAILVNPYDLEDLKGAIRKALTMTPAEQAARMSAMREHLRTHDIRAWISRFLTCLRGTT